MSTTTAETSAKQGDSSAPRVELKGLTARPMPCDWSVAERDWHQGQCRIVAAMRRELTIAAGGFHTLCALQVSDARVAEDVAARLPQFQHLTARYLHQHCAGYQGRSGNFQGLHGAVHAMVWLAKQPAQGRMFLLFNPDAMLEPRIALLRLPRLQSQKVPSAYALVAPGQTSPLFASALRGQGYILSWEETVQSNGRHWHLSIWRSTEISRPESVESANGDPSATAAPVTA